MSKSKKFWRLENSVERSESTLYLDGPIAQESWWGDEVTPQEFRQELQQIPGNELTVVINSPGGDVWAGVSIHDALKELNKKVTVRVSGLAASAASFIAMAGDVIEMTPGSTMMIHKASAIAWGDTEDFKKMIEMLETVEDGIISIYADRTGNSREAVKELVEAETWMSAEKAVELGFADSVVKPASEDEQNAPANVFGGNFAFSMSADKKAMNSFLDKLKAANGVGEAPVEEDEETPTPTEEPEAPVEPAEEPTPAVEPETPAEEVEEPVAPVEPTEPVAPDNKVTNSVENKEVVMTKTAEEIAKDQVVTPSNQAPVEPKANVADYLKSKQAMNDFARILEEQAGKSSEEVRDAWGKHLEVTNGVTNPEILLPDALITEIEDAFKQGGEIWNRVTKTGLDVFKAAWDTVTGEDSRAKGYNRADQADKAEELITIATRVIRPQFVYKYITLNKEDVKEQRSTGALVRYVLSELPRRIVREVERAIVIGDGRADGDDYKIDSFVAIKADTTAENVFAETYVPVEGEANYDKVVRAADLLDNDGAVVLIAKKSFVSEMKLERNESGQLLFPIGTDLNSVLEVDAVIKPDWMEEDEDNDAYLVILANYKTVGDNTVEAFTNFILKQNKQEYLQELWAGGGLTKRKSAVAIQSDGESS